MEINHGTGSKRKPLIEGCFWEKSSYLQALLLKNSIYLDYSELPKIFSRRRSRFPDNEFTRKFNFLLDFYIRIFDFFYQ